MAEQSDNRARMLALIRNALGHTAAPVTPEPLPAFDSHVPAADYARLLETFSRELEKVGGRVSRAQSAEDLRQVLQVLYSPEEYATVAVSACEVLDRVGLREWLVSTGRQVVSSLEEFVRAQSAATQTHSGQDPAEPLKTDLVDQYKRVLMEADLGITCADYALADTGTLVLISGAEQHRLISVLPPVHVCLLDPRHIFASLTEFLAREDKAYQRQGSQPPNAMTCITGPSRTADIELTITMGIHGPRALQVVLYPCTEN
jgi:L-lactate dehydrogenase complex protein LldG